MNEERRKRLSIPKSLMINAVELKVRATFTEEVLGTASSNQQIHSDYIASKAPDALSIEEEVEAVGVDEVVEKGMTIFPRLDDGTPFVWDYQIRGFFKDACAALKKVPGMESSKIKAFKKEIDGLVFIEERKIPFNNTGDIGNCQRPLRASTAQGERVALSNSEAIQENSYIEFTVVVLKKDLLKAVKEWLDFGCLRGLGQWRNSGKGRFTWEEIKD